MNHERPEQWKGRVLPAAMAATVLVTMALAGCTVPGAPGPSVVPGSADNPETKTVQMTGDDKYDPHLVTVGKGDTVRWVNADSDAHTVTSDDASGPLNSGNVTAGKDFSAKFDTLGVFSFHCVFHATKQPNGTWTGMVGTITVEA